MFNFGLLSYRKDTESLECIQRREAKLTERLENKTRGVTEGLFSLKNERLRGGLILLYNSLEGGCSKAGDGL